MIVPCNHEGVLAASRMLKKGGIVAFPTDTVYGIGCDPFNQKAVNEIYRIKGREESKPLPVLGFSIFEISKIALFDETSRKLASKFWPGPLTLILTVRDEMISKSLGLDGKIAVRIPSHPCALSLLQECKLLVGTSANRSGQKPAGDSTELVEKISGYDLLLDGGRISNPVESTIIEVSKGRVRIVRKGKISEREIESAI